MFVTIIDDWDDDCDNDYGYDCDDECNDGYGNDCGDDCDHLVSMR